MTSTAKMKPTPYLACIMLSVAACIASGPGRRRPLIRAGPSSKGHVASAPTLPLQVGLEACEYPLGQR